MAGQTEHDDGEDLLHAAEDQDRIQLHFRVRYACVVSSDGLSVREVIRVESGSSGGSAKTKPQQTIVVGADRR